MGIDCYTTVNIGVNLEYNLVNYHLEMSKSISLLIRYIQCNIPFMAKNLIHVTRNMVIVRSSERIKLEVLEYRISKCHKKLLLNFAVKKFLQNPNVFGFWKSVNIKRNIGLELQTSKNLYDRN